MRRLLSAALLGASALATPLARAEPAAATRLTWTRDAGAESCVSAEELQRLLVQVLGESEPRWPLGDATIDGLVSKADEPDTWRVRLRVVQADGSVGGQREISTSQPLCSALTSSVLLVLLMLVEPDAADRGLPTEVVQAITQQADAEARARQQPPVVSAPVSPQPVLPNLPRATAPSHRAMATSSPTTGRASLRWRAHLEPTLSLGLLPSATLGVSGGLGLVTRDGWQVALLAAYAGSDQIELAPNSYVSAGHIVASALLLDLSACPQLLARARWRLNGCAGATLVRRSFETPTLAVHTDPARSSLGPSVGGHVSFAVNELWHLLFRATVAMPLPRDRFVYEDGERAAHLVYAPARVFANLGLGLGAEL